VNADDARVEVLRVGDFVVIRGTEAPEWPTTVTVDAWATFIEGVKSGYFDELPPDVRMLGSDGR
jgi:hypothetical protein